MLALVLSHNILALEGYAHTNVMNRYLSRYPYYLLQLTNAVLKKIGDLDLALTTKQNDRNGQLL